MFERIQTAYAFVSAASEHTGPDPERLKLFVNAQVILYARYTEDLKPYKYSGYDMLLPLILKDVQVCRW